MLAHDVKITISFWNPVTVWQCNPDNYSRKLWYITVFPLVSISLLQNTGIVKGYGAARILYLYGKLQGAYLFILLCKLDIYFICIILLYLRNYLQLPVVFCSGRLFLRSEERWIVDQERTLRNDCDWLTLILVLDNTWFSDKKASVDSAREKILGCVPEKYVFMIGSQSWPLIGQYLEIGPWYQECFSRELTGVT